MSIWTGANEKPGAVTPGREDKEKNMKNLEIFEYQYNNVRVVAVDGEPWFVLTDLCGVLGLSNPSVVAERVDPDALSTTEVIDSLGRTQNARVVSEAGMYEVIFMSRKPEAKQFKRWITSVVLPEIRKTGSFGVAFDPTSLEGAAQLVQAAQTALSALAVAQPKADAWDELASAEGDYEVADAAKILARAGIETGQRRLFTYLNEIGWLYRGSHGKWAAYQRVVDNGWLAEIPQSHFHPRTGVKVIDPPQVRVTVRGLERLRELMKPVEVEELVDA